MKELIDKTAGELGVSIQQQATTFEGKFNWFYHEKTKVLGEMLDRLIELQEKENLLLKK